ncbi:BGTF surface domain-containing protein [Halosimplex aquaticum]|uniref:BGTF surface domain-containing protein n=1 Tax=Halosimplex aquaticum TaxID=3026162 RepID=A0ABD5Y3Q6_9EURY
MKRRTYGTVGIVAVVLVAALAVVSAGGVPLGGDGPADATVTPDRANATTIHHDGSHLSLEGAANQTISGETDLAPGTELAVRVVSDEPASPFLVSETATVGEDGAFSATADLSLVDADADAWVTVYGNGTELANVSARIAAVESETPTDGPDSDGVPSLEYEGDRLTLAALENETVRGETNLSAGSEVTVRLTSTSDASPFLVQNTATVAEDGTFAAPVDLVGIANGSTFEAVVRHDGETLASAEGIVVGGVNEEPTGDSTPTNRTGTVEESSRVAEEDHNTTLDYDGDKPTVESAAGQEIAGETDLPAGSNVTLRIASKGGANPFLKSATATVSEDGRFTAGFNMTGVPSGTTFEVVVYHDGERLAVADGEVVE